MRVGSVVANIADGLTLAFSSVSSVSASPSQASDTIGDLGSNANSGADLYLIGQKLDESGSEMQKAAIGLAFKEKVAQAFHTYGDFMQTVHTKLLAFQHESLKAGLTDPVATQGSLASMQKLGSKAEKLLILSDDIYKYIDEQDEIVFQGDAKVKAGEMAKKLGKKMNHAALNDIVAIKKAQAIAAANSQAGSEETVSENVVESEETPQTLSATAASKKSSDIFKVKLAMGSAAVVVAIAAISVVLYTIIKNKNRK
jgi:hypothetical protein